MNNKRTLTTQSIKMRFGGENGMGKQVQRKRNRHVPLNGKYRF